MKPETPQIHTPEIPAIDEALVLALDAIDITGEDIPGSLDSVKDALSKRHDWSQREIDPWNDILDEIKNYYQQTLLPDTADTVKRVSYANMQRCIERLPDASGVRKKVQEIIITHLEEELQEHLMKINPGDNDALDHVAAAILKKYDWDEEGAQYVELIRTIQNDFRQIITPSEGLTKEALRTANALLYAEIKDYTDRLPETSGLRDTVKMITYIPDLE